MALAINEEDIYLIEIKKTTENFEDGELYKIKINLLEEIDKELWIME